MRRIAAPRSFLLVATLLGSACTLEPLPPSPPAASSFFAGPAFDLPIEVIGAEGKTVQRPLHLSRSQASDARYLWLQINNLGYQDKASVRINSGSWVSLNHNTADLAPQEASRGGMVRGGFGTIRLTVPVNTQLREGENTLSFRFNYSDGISIGYRVVGLNLQNQRGTNLLEDSMFAFEDPDTWSPPFTSQADIDEGENLWRHAPLQSNYLTKAGKWYAYSLPANQPIEAKCADCHAQDGRDLELFAYSNDSIIERSIFHGLSRDQGKKIASYIRSLSSRHSTVGRYGRPWNPPFQPGPSVANRPIHEWLAGAGLDAVLDDDSDMLEGMFGKSSNISQAEVEAYFDSDKMWDTTTQPLAVQLPDWKHWLPLIHPKDAFSRNNYYNSTKQYDPRLGLARIRGYLASNRGRYTRDKLFHELHEFWQHFRQFLAQGGSPTEHWRTKNGDAFTIGLKNGVSKEMAAASLAKYMGVKFFELHHEFGLHGLAPGLIDANEQPRARSWLGRQYNIFEIPPHFTACFKTGNARCHNYEGQPVETGEYESTSWYQLQQVINPGIATSREVVPMDYNYQPTLILRASQTSGHLEPVRFYFSQNVMYQTRTQFEYFTPNDREGFNMRVMGPWLMFGADNRNNFEELPVGEIPAQLNALDPGLGTKVVTAQLKQFLKEMNKPRNSLDIWNRRANNNSGEHYALDPISLTTADMPSPDRPFSGPLYHYAHKIYTVIPRFIEFGVECPVIEGLKDWSKRAWPNIDWERFTCTPPPPPTTDSTLAGGQRLNEGEFLTSPNGKYEFGIEVGGDLVLRSGDRVWWSAGLCCRADFMAMQRDGNLVVRGTNGSAIWKTDTPNNRDAVLQVEDQGRVVVRSANGIELWSSGPGAAGSILEPGRWLNEGEFLTSPGGLFELGIETNGDLVLRSNGYVFWSADLCCRASFMTMQRDGNLVVRDTNNRAIWSTRTSNNRDSILYLEESGRASIENAQGNETWSTGAALSPTVIGWLKWLAAMSN